MAHTRRQLLAATAGLVGFGGLAGCTGDGAGASASPGTTARASFFVFGDVASAVAGETATAELLVPVGQHGHGWEPGPRVREDVHDADLFVHGMEGFQPWVDDVRADLAADGSDVATVDVTEDVDLLRAGDDHAHGDDDGADHSEEDGDHEGNHDGHEHDGGESDDHDHDEADGHHDDHEDAQESEDGGHEDHDTPVDPHFWMDPIRLQDAVGTVRDALAEVDGDGADSYDENAAAFRTRLDDLHGRIEATVDAGSTDVLLVAGHDSFGYLGDRYDLDVRALTNVSPDDRPTLRDNERAQAVIEEHDLRYVCADPLESQEAAERLVAETDAEEVLPLTALPGLRDSWAENDWGYVDVMENVNLPTLERALEA